MGLEQALPDPKSRKILIVDDDPGQRSLLTSFLKGQGFETLAVSSGTEALKTLETQSFHMIISDVRMPGLTGLETLHRVRERKISIPVLLVTAFPDVRDAVGAGRDGAVNYLQKPIDLDELLDTVRKATGIVAVGEPSIEGDKRLPPHVVAVSPAMREVFREAALVADSESRILLTGESGVGKEVVADVIHGWSPRAGGPIVKVNCAAIPENLLESELFGHEKGAFTGAQGERIGRFEQANNGTILLDEIAEMSPALQAKLLRIIQDGHFQRLGSNKDRQTNARLLAATNRNLETEVAKGSFREDLFYRLNVVEIHIPAPRDRPEDILPLALQFVAELSDRRPRCSPAVIGYLERYRWPGNVRELRNTMERATLLCHGELILPEHLVPRIKEAAGETKPTETSGDVVSAGSRLDEIEQKAILQALKEHRYNRTETARALGISRRALTYKIQRLRALGHEVDGE